MSWCDYKDQNGDWKLARLISKSEKECILMIDGTGQTITCCQHLIHPPRKYSIGYNAYDPAIRDLDITVEHIQKIHNFILILIERNFTAFQPSDITEFLRCELFVLVDTIIRYPAIKIEDDVNVWFENILMDSVELTTKWMQDLPLLFSEVCPSIDSKGFKLFN